MNENRFELFPKFFNIKNLQKLLEACITVKVNNLEEKFSRCFESVPSFFFSFIRCACEIFLQ